MRLEWNHQRTQASAPSPACERASASDGEIRDRERNQAGSGAAEDKAELCYLVTCLRLLRLIEWQNGELKEEQDSELQRTTP
ncbi:hypothetical protein SRHO_G00246390 [Serrasalmus rhombeus]